MRAPGTTISIDSGKSQLRLLVADGRRREVGIGPGVFYRPGDDDVDRLLDSVRAAAGSVTVPSDVTSVIAGLTGLPGDVVVRREVASGLAALFDAPAVLADDALLAHAGALDGPGTVLCVGTGTAVLSIGTSGSEAKLDGWGPVLGDRGSGHAIGLAGLRAAASALDGVGPPTALVDSLRVALGGTDLASLQSFYRDPHLVARVAAFARDVLVAAAHDGVARSIAHDAARDLAVAAHRAAASIPDASPAVSYSGRVITTGGALRTRLQEELDERGLHLADPVGSPLEGGLILLSGSHTYAAVLASAWRESGTPRAGGRA